MIIVTSVIKKLTVRGRSFENRCTIIMIVIVVTKKLIRESRSSKSLIPRRCVTV